MRKPVLFALLLAWSNLASAETLLDIFRLAQEHDAASAAVRHGLEARDQLLPQGRAGLLPSLGIGADTAYNINETEFDRGSGFISSFGGAYDYNSRGYGVTLRQPLLDLRALSAFKRAKSEVAQAQIQFAISQQDLILRAVRLYFNCLLCQDNLDVVLAEKDAISKRLAQAKREFDVGTGTITDVNEAQARFDLTVSKEIGIRNGLDIASAELAKTIGRPATNLARLAKDFALELPSPNEKEAWIERARQSNLFLLAQQHGVEIARQDLNMARSARLPVIDVAASRSWHRSRSFGGWANDVTFSSVMLRLQMPLFEGGANRSRVKQTEANYLRTQDEHEDAERLAVLDASRAFWGVSTACAQVKALEQALQSSQSSLESTQRGFEQGFRTTVDVLNALEQVYAARHNLLQQSYSYLIARLELQAAVGSLGLQDLIWTDSMLAKAE